MEKNKLAVVALLAAGAIGVGTVYATSPARQSHLETTGVTVSQTDSLKAVPPALTEAYRIEDSAEPARYQPIEANGVVLGTRGNDSEATVTGYDATTGDELWSYHRELPLCMVTKIDGAAVATFKNNAGCGDVTSITLADGKYKDTRSAPAPDAVAPVASNSYVGTVAPASVELWRNDLVRTVIYGDVPNPQEPNYQPHPECSITSALTRTSLLALTETCPDGRTWLRIQGSKPEDSRKPELSGEAQLNPGSVVVATGEEQATVLAPSTVPGKPNYFMAFGKDGKTSGFSATDATMPDHGEVFTPAVGDLPHNMTWFDGENLHLFHPTSLQEEYTLTGVLGTGAAIGEKILVPVAGGIAVYALPSTQPESIIPVDRGDYSGPVHLRIAGGAIVEKRGDLTVGLVGQ